MSKKVDKLVAAYRQLRDKKRLLKQQYTAKVEQIDALMDKIEGQLLKFMDEAGLESVKTDVGTAYVSTITRANVSDWQELVSWVKRTDKWEVLTKGVNKTAALELLEEEGELPPGVSLYRERTVNIRK